MTSDAVFTAYLFCKELIGPDPNSEIGEPLTIEIATNRLKNLSRSENVVDAKIINSSSLYKSTSSSHLFCVVELECRLISGSVECPAAHLRCLCKKTQEEMQLRRRASRSASEAFQMNLFSLNKGCICEVCTSSEKKACLEAPSAQMRSVGDLLRALKDIDPASAISLLEALGYYPEVVEAVPQVVVGCSTLWPLSGLKSDCKIVGIMNCTPDSFSDGGLLWEGSMDGSQAEIGSKLYRVQVNRVQELLRDGCHMIDIGAESTRPGAREVPPEVQINRLGTLVRYMGSSHTHIPVSIDTRHAQVFEWCVKHHPSAGINDVSGLRYDSQMLRAACDAQRLCIIMHSRGTPETMTQLVDYTDMIRDVAESLTETITLCLKAGVFRWRIMADPGVGFAKSLQQNVELLKGLGRLRSLLPAGIFLMLGMSRKRFLKKINPGLDYAFDDSYVEDDSNTEELWKRLDAKSKHLMDKYQVFQSVCCLRVHDPKPYRDWLGGSSGGGWSHAEISEMAKLTHETDCAKLASSEIEVSCETTCASSPTSSV